MKHILMRLLTTWPFHDDGKHAFWAGKPVSISNCPFHFNLRPRYNSVDANETLRSRWTYQRTVTGSFEFTVRHFAGWRLSKVSLFVGVERIIWVRGRVLQSTSKLSEKQHFSAKMKFSSHVTNSTLQIKIHLFSSIHEETKYTANKDATVSNMSLLNYLGGFSLLKASLLYLGICYADNLQAGCIIWGLHDSRFH